MNIIFGKEHADKLSEKYTVLELDTICFSNNSATATAYCIVEDMPFDEIPMLESMKLLHKDLLVKYQSRNWTTCLEIIRRLEGFWNGELDSFYADLRGRIEALLLNPPPTDWTPVIQK